IVCGSLVRAIRKEAAIAIVHNWGISPATLTMWRTRLGVGRDTAGSLRLKSHNARQFFSGRPKSDKFKQQMSRRAKERVRNSEIQTSTGRKFCHDVRAWTDSVPFPLVYHFQPNSRHTSQFPRREPFLRPLGPDMIAQGFQCFRKCLAVLPDGCNFSAVCTN